MAPQLRTRKPAASTAAKASPAGDGKRKAADEASPVAPKKAKAAKKDEVPKKSKAVRADEPKKLKTKKQKAEEPKPTDDEHPFLDEAELEDNDDALALAGIEDSDNEDAAMDATAEYKEGQDVGKIPDKSTALETAKRGKGGEETGVVYVGRLPHGFFEHQMRAYFEQFGTINKLRLSRNKKTGKPKHYAFIEFAEESAANIVAKTMDNYLLFGHILKVKLVPRSQVHDSLWKGANQRYKHIPRNRMEANKLKKPRSEAQWEKAINMESKKRTDRAQKLKDMGYEFEAPELKHVEKPSHGTDALESGEEKPKAVEAPPPKAEAAETSDAGDGVESLDGDRVVKKPVAKASKKSGAKAGKQGKVKKAKAKKT